MNKEQAQKLKWGDPIKFSPHGKKALSQHRVKIGYFITILRDDLNAIKVLRQGQRVIEKYHIEHWDVDTERKSFAP